MYQELARKAIQAALSNDWQEALSLNLEILSQDERNVDALNRISQAYIQIGELLRAQESAQRVYLIDPLNPIALKCLEKCKVLKDKDISSIKDNHVSLVHNLFIEEPGKTKIVSLVNTCEPSVLALLSPGETVKMLPRQRRVVVSSMADHYLGKLPDDIAIRIITLTNGGYEFSSHLKSISKKEVKVFIRHIDSENSLKSFNKPFA